MEGQKVSESSEGLPESVSASQLLEVGKAITKARIYGSPNVDNQGFIKRYLGKGLNALQLITREGMGVDIDLRRFASLIVEWFDVDNLDTKSGKSISWEELVTKYGKHDLLVLLGVEEASAGLLIEKPLIMKDDNSVEYAEKYRARVYGTDPEAKKSLLADLKELGIFATEDY